MDITPLRRFKKLKKGFIMMHCLINLENMVIVIIPLIY